MKYKIEMNTINFHTNSEIKSRKQIQVNIRHRYSENLQKQFHFSSAHRNIHVSVSELGEIASSFFPPSLSSYKGVSQHKHILCISLQPVGLAGIKTVWRECLVYSNSQSSTLIRQKHKPNMKWHGSG